MSCKNNADFGCMHARLEECESYGVGLDDDSCDTFLHDPMDIYLIVLFA